MNIATALIYLLAAVFFIIGLQFLSSPARARRGNLVAAAGMVLALGWTLVLLWGTFTPAGVTASVAGVAIGAVAGTLGARTVKMTAVPQMVALFNGVGGGAAALIALAELLKQHPGHTAALTILPSAFAVMVGGVSFAGSMVAFGKLQGLITGTPVTYPGQPVVNVLLTLAWLGVLVVLLVVNGSAAVLAVLLVLALAVGVAMVLPIGGANMPVVISLLNAFTGLAVAATGFVLDNFALIVAGTLVGASGTLLTKLMSDAMGRPLTGVLFGAFQPGQTGAVEGGTGGEERPTRVGSVDDIGTMLAYAQRVIIVPGYGLAVAQGQHAVRELADVLEQRGVEVTYAIHPVAGRMPGHMNVLLAEANVPYEQLKEMDEINDQFKLADVVLVVGANDVVNPAARNSPSSPIYGMPILNADQARAVVFLKRSTRPGFSGTENDLLYDPRTIILFGDARDSLTKLIAAVKAA
ncbi:MAG TPA: NAD(P)(+) transhydrogenase (Re/Si-specific) subunit beta [Ktedonobacterales bacterium]|nr:NAD(P)(+) transhydrogenase (Re/Si-specific) subunit beta [Ktedonobacterales bacterium]